MEKNRLQKIYQKTDGYCHICHKKLSFSNYGVNGAKGCWHVEHSIPLAKGGSDHLNNLFPACIACNIEKGTKPTKTERSKYGNTRAPFSKKKKDKIRYSNTVSGAFVGGGIGLAAGGPVGGLIGCVVGSLIGNENSPKK
jgi:5-methylcytosine-specific restriction endonuclease McrA